SPYTTGGRRGNDQNLPATYFPTKSKLRLIAKACLNPLIVGRVGCRSFNNLVPVVEYRQSRRVANIRASAMTFQHFDRISKRARRVDREVPNEIHQSRLAIGVPRVGICTEFEQGADPI